VTRILPGVVCLLVIAGAATASAQSPADLQQPLEQRCSEPNSLAPDACALLRELLAADSGTAASRNWAHSQLQHAKLLAERTPDRSMSWYTLAIADLIASRAGVIAGTGPLQPPGMTHEAAAGRALLRALELDSGFVAAAQALALVPRPREGAVELKRQLPALRLYRGELSGLAQLSAARKEREAGSLLEALAWLAAISTSESVPAGMVEVERARVLYLMDRTEQGSVAYYAGATDTSELVQRGYRADLALVASPAELADWDSTPAALHSDWLRVFWGSRDVLEGWPVGTRLKEHHRRVELAWRDYRLTIPITGYHRVLSVARHTDFFAEELLQRMFSEDAPGNEKAASYDRLRGEKDLIGRGGMLRAFTGSIEGLDDRGLVLIRHGEPDKSARTVGGESLVLWLYHRPDGPLLLTFRETDFDGQVGASVLTPTAMGADPLQRQQLCHLDVQLCPFDADPTSQFLVSGQRSGGVSTRQPTELQRFGTGVVMQKARRDGMAAINTATTTDANLRRFERSLGARVLFHGVHKAGSVGSTVLIPFAIPGDRLTGAPISQDDPRVGYRIRFEVEAVRERDGLNRRLDTIRAFAAPHQLDRGEYLTGLLELPLPPGRYSVSLVTSDGSGAGEVVSLSALESPDASSTSLGDLVLGNRSSGVGWNNGAQTVALNPLNTFSRDGDAELFTQLFNVSAGTEFQTRIEIWPAETTARAPDLSIEFAGRSDRQVTSISQTLGLSRLEPGQYRLRLVVAVAGRELASEAWLTVVD
jgi:hypothetical protein